MPWSKTNQNSDAQIYPPKSFQEAWLLALESPYIEKIVLSKSSRVGYAIFINTATAWLITNDPGNIMIVQNTEKDANKFATKEIGKVFTYCPPVIDRLIGKNTATEKSFYGGDISVVWATSGSSLRMATIKYLFMDEVSGWYDNVDKEGDPVDLAIVRTETEAQRKIVLGSTPKEAGTCKITREFLLTDQRYLYVPCPHCQYKQRLKLENLRYKPKKWRSAHFVCTHCTKKIEEHHKFTMVNAGEWRATREFTCCDTYQHPNRWDETGTALCRHCEKPGDTNERGKVDAGFHIWSAYNDNPNTALASIAAEYDKAKKDPLKMQTFMNTKVGVEYSDTQRAHKLNNFDALYERRESYSPLDKLPEGIIAAFATIDNQKNRFEYHTWGIGAKGEMWAIDYGKIHGDPEDEQIQKQLINELSREFTLHDCRKINIHAIAIDCQGLFWKSMLEFCQQYKGWVYAIRGSASAKERTSHDMTLHFKTDQETTCDYRTINVHKLKNRAAERLNNNGEGKNYIHFPKNETFDLDYFQMITAEELIGSGNKSQWKKKKDQPRNEPWDLLVYMLWLCDFYISELKSASQDNPLGLVDPVHSQHHQNDFSNDYEDGYELSNHEHY